MERFVLDTSVFTNPAVYSQFADNALDAVALFIDLARRSGAEFYMPGSVYDELRKIKDLDGYAAQFETVVRIRSPRKFNLQVPASLLYEFIEEVRLRIDRGLRIAEEHAKMGRGTDGDVGKVIGRLRERYREALRQGIIDSREDADVLLLAYELDGVVVAADEGLRKWTDKVGVKILMPQHLRPVLEDLIEHQPAAE